MPTFKDLARRKPQWFVAAAFLWAPIVLIIALQIGREALVPALLLAALPYLAILLWALVVAVIEARPVTRGALLLGLLLFILFAVGVNWGPPPEY